MKDSRNNRRTRSGYTLTETATVVTLLGVLSLFIVGDHRGQRPRYVLDRTALQLAVTLRAARMQAVSENTPVTVNLDLAQKQCAVCADSNTNGIIDADEQELQSLDYGNNVAMQANATQGCFDSRGVFTSSNFCWNIQVTVPDVGCRWIHVMPSGQIDCSR